MSHAYGNTYDELNDDGYNTTDEYFTITTFFYDLDYDVMTKLQCLLKIFIAGEAHYDALYVINCLDMKYQ